MCEITDRKYILLNASYHTVEKIARTHTHTHKFRRTETKKRTYEIFYFKSFIFKLLRFSYFASTFSFSFKVVILFKSISTNKKTTTTLCTKMYQWQTQAKLDDAMEMYIIEPTAKLNTICTQKIFS